MTASDYLNRDQFYHVADTTRRDSITRGGLTAHQPESGDAEPGVYVFRARDEHEAADRYSSQYAQPGHSYDVYQVNTARLPVHEDAAWPAGQSAVVGKDVASYRVKRVHTFGG